MWCAISFEQEIPFCHNWIKICVPSRVEIEDFSGARCLYSPAVIENAVS